MRSRLGQWVTDEKKNLLKSLLLLTVLAVLIGVGLWYAFGLGAQVYPIALKVDFGPAGRAVYEGTLDVERGTTPKEAVSQVFPILSGKSCCSLREVVAIDGVRVDPLKKRWWICLLNGTKNVSPQKRCLRPGDKVEWKYIQN